MAHPRDTRGRKLTFCFCLAVLEVIQKYVEAFTVNTILLDDNTTASHNFPGITFTIDLAKTSPRSQNFSIPNLDQVDFMLGAESFDKLDVFCLCAGLDEYAQMGLAFIQSFGTFAETAS